MTFFIQGKEVKISSTDVLDSLPAKHIIGELQKAKHIIDKL